MCVYVRACVCEKKNGRKDFADVISQWVSLSLRIFFPHGPCLLMSSTLVTSLKFEKRYDNRKRLHNRRLFKGVKWNLHLQRYYINIFLYFNRCFISWRKCDGRGVWGWGWVEKYFCSYGFTDCLQQYFSDAVSYHVTREWRLFIEINRLKSFSACWGCG